MDELLLVHGVTPDLLYGMDANRNGVLDDEEMSGGGISGGGLSTGINPGNDTSRGWYPFLSVTGPGNARFG